MFGVPDHGARSRCARRPGPGVWTQRARGDRSSGDPAARAGSWSDDRDADAGASGYGGEYGARIGHACHRCTRTDARGAGARSRGGLRAASRRRRRRDRGHDGGRSSADASRRVRGFVRARASRCQATGDAIARWRRGRRRFRWELHRGCWLSDVGRARFGRRRCSRGGEHIEIDKMVERAALVAGLIDDLRRAGT